jgi:ribonuclease J
MRDAEDLIEEAKNLVIEALSNGHRDTASVLIRDTLAEFLYRRTRRRPMIFPVVLEV